MNQRILVLSGKKQSGKNTLANFLQGLELVNLGFIKEFEVSTRSSGKLWVKLWDDGEFSELDLSSKETKVVEWASTNLWPVIKQYGFADSLKELCMNVLLLSYEQCYGTDEQKATPTKYLWENMPGLSNTMFADRIGPMLARDLMKYTATEIFRKMYGNIWVESTLRRIEKEASEFVIITDCRFANEVLRAQNVGAKVIRLTRNIDPDDAHTSETELDPNNFDWNKFDHVIDNQNISVEDCCVELVKVLKKWNWFNYEMNIN